MTQKTIVFWAPYRGRIGTIEAVVNYYNSLADDYQIYLLQVAGEWDEWAEKMPNAKIISVWDSDFAKRIGIGNRFHRRDYYFLVVLSIFKVRRIVRQLSPFAVVAFLQLIPFAIAIHGFSFRRFASLQGSPSFVIGDAQIEWYKKIEEKIRLVFWARILPSFDAIICMTDSSRALVKRKFGRATVLHIGNALFQSKPPKHEFNGQDAARALVFVGRLEYQKNPERFLEIAQQLLSLGGFSWEVHIFGDGSLRNKLERQAGPGIKFHGHIENPWGAIQDLNAIHLITSRWEDPGHAIIEGLARGVPTIIEDNGADFVKYYQNATAGLVVESHQILENLLDIDNRVVDTSALFYHMHSVQNLKLNLRDLLEDNSF